MLIREWSGAVIGVIAALWALVVTGLFWGSSLREAWRSRTQSDTVCIVAHTSVWLVYLALVIVPPVVLAWVWWRGRAV
jgi:hypothetical protein